MIDSLHNTDIGVLFVDEYVQCHASIDADENEVGKCQDATIGRVNMRLTSEVKSWQLFSEGVHSLKDCTNVPPWSPLAIVTA